MSKDICTEFIRGNRCQDQPDFDYDDGVTITDISYCCCDTDLCNGAEGTYYSMLTIFFTLTMTMII